MGIAFLHLLCNMEGILSLLHHTASNGKDTETHGQVRDDHAHPSCREIKGALLSCTPFHAVKLANGLRQEGTCELVIQVQQWTQHTWNGWEKQLPRQLTRVGSSCQVVAMNHSIDVLPEVIHRLGHIVV